MPYPSIADQLVCEFDVSHFFSNLALAHKQVKTKNDQLVFVPNKYDQCHESPATLEHAEFMRAMQHNPPQNHDPSMTTEIVVWLLSHKFRDHLPPWFREGRDYTTTNEVFGTENIQLTPNLIC